MLTETQSCTFCFWWMRVAIATIKPGLRFGKTMGLGLMHRTQKSKCSMCVFFQTSPFRYVDWFCKFMWGCFMLSIYCHCQNFNTSRRTWFWRHVERRKSTGRHVQPYVADVGGMCGRTLSHVIGISIQEMQFTLMTFYLKFKIKCIIECEFNFWCQRIVLHCCLCSSPRNTTGSAQTGDFRPSIGGKLAKTSFQVWHFWLFLAWVCEGFCVW